MRLTRASMPSCGPEALCKVTCAIGDEVLGWFDGLKSTNPKNSPTDAAEPAIINLTGLAVEHDERVNG